MKKTLLIAAAALAAGVISSQAQVYSQNVVGYVNQTIPAHGYSIVGNQLINGSDANGTNGDINTCLVNGFISSPANNVSQDPSISSNSVLYVWGGPSSPGYQTYYFFNAADATTWEGATSPAGWYTAAGVYAAGIYLTPSLAAFVQNSSYSSSPMTITTVGTVLQGTNVVQIKAGYNMISLQEPIGGTNAVADASGNPLPYGLPTSLTSSNDSATVSDSPNQNINDALFYWTGSGYATYYFFNAADATTWEGAASPAGFYDAAGNSMSADLIANSQTLGVNQGFFLYHSGATVNWTNVFNVQ